MNKSYLSVDFEKLNFLDKNVKRNILRDSRFFSNFPEMKLEFTTVYFYMKFSFNQSGHKRIFSPSHIKLRYNNPNNDFKSVKRP